MEAELKKREEDFMERMGDRFHPMMMMGGGPDLRGTKWHELFSEGKPFGEGGDFCHFSGRVTKHARDRGHPDDNFA